MKRAIQLIPYDGFLYALLDDGSIWRRYEDKPWIEVDLPWEKEEPPLLTGASWREERKPAGREESDCAKVAAV